MIHKFKDCLSVEDKYTHVENDGSYYFERRRTISGGLKLTIYFEWSNGKTDWINNFDFPAKPYRKMDNLWFCHRGFLKVWKSIEPCLADVIKDISVEEIEIIGYSHGGAIAQLCYEYVKFNRADVKVTGYGFGAPRVVWGFAKKPVKRRFEDFVVVRNGNDIVTHLPPVIFGFRHIAKVCKVGESEGLIKDHYPEKYIEALEKTEVADNVQQ